MDRSARTRLVLACLIALSLALGWHLRWVLDDAYISFRYAWNWVHGHGLVFNPGEMPPVEGYTNFLWTLLSALPIAMGLDPTIPMLATALVCAGVALLATFELARRLGADDAQALSAVALVGLNYSFLCFATSGLETMLQCALLTSAMALALRSAEPASSDRTQRRHTARLVALSLCGALALLTRLDSAVPGAVIFGWWLASTRAQRREQRRAALLALLAPAGAILVAWFAWKLATYGAWLPNTFAAREVDVPAALRLGRGVRYIAGFASDYWLWPFAALAFGWIALWRRRGYALLALVVLAWCAYVVGVGADYMEYRFMVPVIPALVILLVVATAALHRRALPVLVIALLASSALHGRANDGSPLGHGRMIPHPEALAAPEVNRWSALRTWVERYPGSDELLWTLPAMGASGYYTRFRIVDMHGLTDRYVARHGDVGVISPAHDKWAPIAYLRERGVVFADSYNDACYYRRFYRDSLADETLVRIGPVEILPGAGVMMTFLYITPHPVVEAMIADGAQRFPVPSQDQCR